MGYFGKHRAPDQDSGQTRSQVLEAGIKAQRKINEREMGKAGADAHLASLPVAEQSTIRRVLGL